jgi:restriction system protein
MSRNFYKVMLGQGSREADACRVHGFLGTDYDVRVDLTGLLPENWREFNAEWLPRLLPLYKSKIAAGLAAGNLWTVSKGIAIGDIVLSPTGVSNELMAGEITSDYHYVPEGPLHHRRSVRWLPGVIKRDELSSDLRSSLGSGGTVVRLERHSEEILRAIGDVPPHQTLFSTDATVEDATQFAMEKYLEEFLIDNWGHTDLGREFDIYSENGEQVGRQFQTDTGPMDILAISKDKKKILVVELKKGRASDSVVGQVQRYMGYVLELLAEPNQEVHGVIIALEDDLKIQRALKVTRNIEFYRYIINFKLEKTSK